MPARPLLERYQRADALLGHNLERLVPAAVVSGAWTGDLLRYRVNEADGERLVQVDPVALTTSGCDALPAPDDPYATTSPDGRWQVTRVDGDLVLTEVATGQARRLTHDAAPALVWGKPADFGGTSPLARSRGAELPLLVCWAPDSSRFYTHLTDEREVPLVTFTEAVPPDGGHRPRVHALHYPFPGEPLAQLTHVVFDVDGGRHQLPLSSEVVLASPVEAQRVWWSDDARQLWLLDETRGRRAQRLYRWDGTALQLVVEETAADGGYVELTPMIGARPMVRTLATGEVLWWSERDGWGHLWLWSAGDWQQVTCGRHQVREIVAFDEQARTVWYLGGGGVPDESPYYRHLYRAVLDGSGPVRLTSEPADHAVTAHPSGQWFLDCYASPRQPPVTVLRGADGEVLLELERADVSRLEALGWTPPEEVRVLAADGRTELWGLLFPPQDLDVGGSYPLLDSMYPGPQATRQARPALPGAPLEPYQLDSGGSSAAFAALGFAVLVLDARSTPLRDRAFHLHSLGDWGDLGLDDHVAAIRQLAAERPWIDLSRVGAMGHSAGGYASARAVMARPDVFSVAASTCGNHDTRGYFAMWGEQYHGLVGEADYDRAATQLLAERLEGKLLLIQGECDPNVHVGLALQLVDALVKADKDFDLLLLPGEEHMFKAAAPYVIRRRWDFLVRHLLGEEPPRGFRVDASAVDGRYAT